MPVGRPQFPDAGRSPFLPLGVVQLEVWAAFALRGPVPALEIALRILYHIFVEPLSDATNANLARMPGGRLVSLFRPRNSLTGSSRAACSKLGPPQRCFRPAASTRRDEPALRWIPEGVP